MTDKAELIARLQSIIAAGCVSFTEAKAIQEAIAALEAKPEPEQTCICADNNRTWRCVAYIPTLPEEDDFRCANCLHDRECHEQKSEPAKPLPESVETWLASVATKENLDWAIDEGTVRGYLTQLHSQHQAELELLRSKLGEYAGIISKCAQGSLRND